MTKDKKLKRAIRARAKESGITYTTARRTLVGHVQFSKPRNGQAITETLDAETIKRRVEIAMAFPLPQVVARYMKDHGVARAEAEVHERELRRYLCIAALYPQDGLPTPRTIDPLWHTFLLFTKPYQHFCREIAGRFIHHEPFDEESDLSMIDERYQRLLDHYRALFGEPPPTIWPPELGELSECADCDQGCQGQCAGSD